MKNLSITNGFIKIGDARLLTKAHQVHEAMNGNPHFPDPVPSMLIFAGITDFFSAAVEDCLYGDRLKAAIKNQKREVLINALHQLADYVLFKAAGDITVAASSGFSIGKPPSPAPLIDPPANLRVKQGPNTGELLNKINRVKGALAYLYQYATDEMVQQGYWKWTTSSRTQCVLKDLQPGTKYHCRVAAIGAKDQFVQSNVVSRIVA